MIMARPAVIIMACSILTLFFVVVSSEAMARGGGAGGGGGGSGYGGGYGGSRGGSIRSAPPGNYRTRRVYDNYTRPKRESGLPPRTGSQSPDSPAETTRPQMDQPASTTGRNPYRTPEGGQTRYRDITEKYEKLREARHKEYWEQRQQTP